MPKSNVRAYFELHSDNAQHVKIAEYRRQSSNKADAMRNLALGGLILQECGLLEWALSLNQRYGAKKALDEIVTRLVWETERRVIGGSSIDKPTVQESQQVTASAEDGSQNSDGGEQPARFYLAEL